MIPKSNFSYEDVHRLAMVAARTINGVIITGVDRKIEWVNDGFTRITGYSLEEVRGKSPGSFLQGPDTDPATVHRIREQLQEKQGFTAELLNYRKSGEPYWVRVEVQSLWDDEGRLTGFMGIETDITETRKFQDELQRSLARQAIIAQLGQRALQGLEIRLLFNEARTLVSEQLGPTYAHVLELSPDAHSVTLSGIPGQSLDESELLFLQAITNTLNSALAREKAAAELIAQRNRAEELARSKSAFLASMSHEIRTPLTGIIGFARVLSDEADGPHREFAELIEHSGRRLLEVLNSVLDLAKLDARQVELNLEDLDLNTEVGDLVQLMRPLVDEDRLSLQFEAYSRGPAYARLDRGALSRILHNLVGNAIKFTDRGHVIVSIGHRDGHVSIEVKDTGIGIDPSFLPQLFSEFTQEHSGLHNAGSGLGLSITKRLVELLGGSISVDSTRGKGSTFTVLFPEAHLKPETGNHTRQETGHPSLEPSEARILVVEDNPDTRQLMLHVLENLYEVDIAGNVEEALEKARQSRFDMFVLDINLGRGRTGLDLERELRAIPDYATAPILALTAYAMPGDREHFLGSGFTAYLGKPFIVDELLDTLSSLLQQAQEK